MSIEKDQEFSTQSGSACAAELEQRLGLTLMTDAIKEAMLDVLTDACYEPGAAPAVQEPNNAGRNLRVGHWVIRDDDLKLFGAVRDTMLAFASASYVLRDLPVSGVTALVFAFLQLGRNARQFGGRLTDRQWQLVIALQNSGRTASRADLLKKLPGWTEAGIDQEVKGLRALPTRAGPMKVVDELTDGQIILCGI
ncbi:MAG TPA: hypothetical protein VH092_00665 [Urbifossiella sp.]|jgi:hypothetical protein|nr:hypothetical protein [Urbifossiella sp.]